MSTITHNNHEVDRLLRCSDEERERAARVWQPLLTTQSAAGRVTKVQRLTSVGRGSATVAPPPTTRGQAL